MVGLTGHEQDRARVGSGAVGASWRCRGWRGSSLTRIHWSFGPSVALPVSHPQRGALGALQPRRCPWLGP